VGKTRGHLGSQLERKAESNLRLSKEGETITVYAERARHAHVTKENGPRFQWSHEEGMHVSVEPAAVTKASTKQQELAAFAAEVFRDAPASIGLTWAQVHERIEDLHGVKREGARRQFKGLVDGHHIQKKGEKWHLK
jgi:hypothetical protein